MSSLQKVLANPGLRRLQLSLVALVVAGSGYQVALAVVAFRAGGAEAVAIAFFVQVLPIALATPFTSALADRFPRRLMVCIDVLRGLCCAAVATAVALDGSLGLSCCSARRARSSRAPTLRRAVRCCRRSCRIPRS